MTRFTPADIERLCALTRSPRADVRDGALGVLRRINPYENSSIHMGE